MMLPTGPAPMIPILCFAILFFPNGFHFPRYYIKKKIEPSPFFEKNRRRGSYMKKDYFVIKFPCQLMKSKTSKWGEAK